MRRFLQTTCLLASLLVAASGLSETAFAQSSTDSSHLLASDAYCEWDRVQASADFIPHAAFSDLESAPVWSLPVPEASFARLSGLANVYPTNPGSSEPTEVTLLGLFGDGSSLNGEFVRAGSDRLDGQGQWATAANGDFRFDPDTTGAVNCPTDLSECSPFDAVNAYWHVDRFAREFWEARMGLSIDFQANVRVHLGGDQAFADWPSRSIKFPVGDIFMKNTALSDDLLYHEYAHLVLASLGFVIGIGVDDQTAALHEAYADYFAATFTDDPRIGAWVVTCPPRLQCTGPPNDREIRTLELDVDEWNWRQGNPPDSLRYGICTRYHEGDQKCKQSWNNYTDTYVWAMIWGAMLWDLRVTFGPNRADQLIMETARLHDESTGFALASSRMREVAQSLFGPNVGGEVEAILLKWGFAGVTNRVWDETPDHLGLELWPNPARTKLQIQVRGLSPSRHHEWTIHDALGRVVDQGQLTGHSQHSISVDRLVPGVYSVCLFDGVRYQNRSFVIIR